MILAVVVVEVEVFNALQLVEFDPFGKERSFILEDGAYRKFISCEGCLRDCHE